MMLDHAVAPLLLAGFPLLGALSSLALWSHADRLRNWSIIWSVISLGASVALTGYLTNPPESRLLVYLLPLAAAVSLLGQPVHQTHRSSWIMTLLFLGLGLGVLTSDYVMGQISQVALFGLVIILLYRHHTPWWPISWRGIGAYGLGALSVMISAIAGPPFSAAGSLLVCAILLPLVPFHDGYLTTLTRLPGSLPSFIVVLFPAIGLHDLAVVIPAVPDSVAWTVSLFALVGMLYGAIKALAQSRVPLVLAYGSLSFISMVWWFATVTRATTPRAAVFVGAVGFATSGLLLAWQVIRTRYGDDVDPQAISGLAFTMPRYAILVSLLALAAMGLPPFGVFAGFLGLLLSSTIPVSTALFLMMTAWLGASWYIMGMAQQWMFGARRSDLRYADLFKAEMMSLVIIVGLLLALGVVPADLFGPDTIAPPTGAVTGSLAWNK